MNKKKFTFILSAIITLAVIFGGYGQVKAQANPAEKIVNFSSVLMLENNGSAAVIETIVYDFGTQERHGIFRVIRNVNAAGEKMDIKLLSVTDEDSTVYKYSISSDTNGLTVKIGDANKTITGVHTYKIMYQATNAATYFTERDELTWNVIGSDWNVPIGHVTAYVRLPQNVAAADITYSCYVGPYRSTKPCATKEVVNPDVAKTPDGSVVVGFEDQQLAAKSDLTVSVGIPKGIITPVAPAKPINPIIGQISLALAFLLPILTVIFMLRYRRKKMGKKDRASIIAEYEPPAGFRPTLVGAVVDASVDDKDLTAGIISAAQQGVLRIIKVDPHGIWSRDDYELELLKPISSLTDTTEKNILDCFFDKGVVGEKVSLRELKKKFTLGPKFLKVKNSIYKDMVKRGLFGENPYSFKMKGTGMIIGAMVALKAVAIFTNITVGEIDFAFFPILVGIFVAAMAAIIIILTIVPRTDLGKETRRKILGFKKFLTITDKERFAFHNAPEKNPQQFMQYLPYAIALGVENKWAEQFKDMYIPQPTWYYSPTHTAFTVASFTRDMSAFTVYSSTRGVAGSSSTGGGFSGGGGGGGGGGSW